MTARILVVCTANVCRSVGLAGLLARALPEVEVFSRGVSAEPGTGPCRVTAGFLARGGVSLAEHRSAQVTVQDIRSSTIVLTATRWQSALVREMYPRAEVRVHAIGAAARIAGWMLAQRMHPSGDEAERVLWLTEQMHLHRERAPKGRYPADDDLADAHGGGDHQVMLPRMLSLFGVLLDELKVTAPQEKPQRKLAQPHWQLSPKQLRPAVNYRRP